MHNHTMKTILPKILYNKGLFVYTQFSSCTSLTLDGAIAKALQAERDFVKWCTASSSIPLHFRDLHHE